MPTYRALQKSFINNRIVEEGETVEYDGEPSANLELVEDAPKADKKAAGKKGSTDDSLT